MDLWGAFSAMANVAWCQELVSGYEQGALMLAHHGCNAPPVGAAFGSSRMKTSLVCSLDQSDWNVVISCYGHQ